MPIDTSPAMTILVPLIRCLFSECKTSQRQRLSEPGEAGIYKAVDYDSVGKFLPEINTRNSAEKLIGTCTLMRFHDFAHNSKLQ